LQQLKKTVINARHEIRNTKKVFINSVLSNYKITTEAGMIPNKYFEYMFTSLLWLVRICSAYR